METVIKNSEGRMLDVKYYMNKANLQSNYTPSSFQVKNFDVYSPQAEAQLVDILTRIMQVLTAIVEAVQDGFQLSDVFYIFTQEANIRAIIDDFPDAIQAFSDLEPVESKNVVIKVKANIGTKVGLANKVVTIVLNALYAGANAFELVTLLLSNGKKQFDDLKLIVSDISIVPDTVIPTSSARVAG